jgi:hypothetical protein
MGINFDSLPTENPYALPPQGIYKAKITKAEMKAGPNGPYLNLTYALSDGKGKRFGNLFDMLSESTHQAVLYKIGRFVSALKLNLKGNCELKDLAKIVVGREMCVDITHQPDKRNETKIRAQIKLFGSECYWPIEQYNELAALNNNAEDDSEDAAPENDESSFEFDAADGMIPAGTPPAVPANDEY